MRVPAHPCASTRSATSGGRTRSCTASTSGLPRLRRRRRGGSGRGDPADGPPRRAGRDLSVADAVPAEPYRDGGYDISDYYGVDPRLGTLGDFVELVRAANDRGVRVICDLVVNHTSDQHPWFQESRSSARLAEAGLVRLARRALGRAEGARLPGEGDEQLGQDDADAGQYYLHRFYHFQPDLDTANAEVREEIARIVGFWLALGVAGFRMDAVPAMLETAGLPERVANDPQRLAARPARVRQPPTRRRDAARRGQRRPAASSRSTSATTATCCTWSSPSCSTSSSGWRSRAGEAEPLETMVRELPARSRRTAAGRPSCATTTS